VPGAWFRVTVFFCFGGASVFAASMKFEIPAQLAPPALMAFSKQARVEVVFSPDD